MADLGIIAVFIAVAAAYLLGVMRGDLGGYVRAVHYEQPLGHPAWRLRRCPECRARLETAARRRYIRKWDREP